MTCSVNYSGNWAPVMTWRRTEGGRVVSEVQPDAVYDVTPPYRSVSSSLTFVVKRNLLESEVSCTTHFNASGRPSSVMNLTMTVPAYQYLWKLPTANLHIQCKKNAVDDQSTYCMLVIVCFINQNHFLHS